MNGGGAFRRPRWFSYYAAATPGPRLHQEAMPVRNVRGFTLIELILVVVIIGILATITIPKFGNTKEKALVAEMKVDLKNLVSAEEAYFSDYTTYTGTLGNLNYNVSTGNTINLISITASGTGWNATATNVGTAKVCGIFIGNASPPITGQVEGQPLCQ
jgi:prepilin-type N-terminal cleavage/methylation domain-containing protein